MGHHPPPGGQPVPAAEVVSGGSGISTVGWVFVIAAIIVVLVMVYLGLRKKK